MSGPIRIPNNWAPRDYQMNVWRYLGAGVENAQSAFGTGRAGKDDVCLPLAAAASMIDKPATYLAYAASIFARCRKAIWSRRGDPHTGKRRIDEAFPHELRVNTNESGNVHPPQEWLDLASGWFRIMVRRRGG